MDQAINVNVLPNILLFSTEFSIVIITLLRILGSCQGQHILLKKVESILGIVSPVDKVSLIIE